jgi:hypothetical protein
VKTDRVEGRGVCKLYVRRGPLSVVFRYSNRRGKLLEARLRRALSRRALLFNITPHCSNHSITPRSSSAGDSLSAVMILCTVSTVSPEALRADVTFAHLHDDNQVARSGVQVAQPHMQDVR